MDNSINAKARSDMMKFTEKSKLKIQNMTKDVLLEVGKRLVLRSPVGNPTKWHPAYWPKGYMPGHFINNWQVGIDVVPTGIINGEEPSGQESLERLSRLGRWQVGHTFYFVNNLPYARRLELGWSSQCPAHGMVGLTQREFPQIVREIAAKYGSQTSI